MDKEFWHNVSMRGQKYYSNDEIKQAIDEYCNEAKLMIVCDHLPHIPRRTIAGEASD